MPAETVSDLAEQSELSRSLRDYSNGLVELLDSSGLQVMDFPGVNDRQTTQDGGVNELSIGITEPYPQRSPRFGAILHSKETREEHLVVSQSTIPKAGEKKTVGYALTNIRDNRPQRLFYSEHPLIDAWRQVREGDDNYQEHLSRFIALTTDGVGVVASHLSLEGGVDADLETSLAERVAALEKFKADSAKKLGKSAEREGITAEEIDDLHADQTRLVQLIADLNRSRTLTGERIPRSQRLPRAEHRQRAEKAKQTLETSYGIKVVKSGVARAVIDRVVADESKLADLKSTKDSDNTKSDRANAILAKRRAHAAKIATLRDRRDHLKQVLS